MYIMAGSHCSQSCLCIQTDEPRYHANMALTAASILSMSGLSTARMKACRWHPFHHGVQIDDTCKDKCRARLLGLPTPPDNLDVT